MARKSNKTTPSKTPAAPPPAKAPEPSGLPRVVVASRALFQALPLLTSPDDLTQIEIVLAFEGRKPTDVRAWHTPIHSTTYKNPEHYLVKSGDLGPVAVLNAGFVPLSLYWASQLLAEIREGEQCQRKDVPVPSRSGYYYPDGSFAPFGSWMRWGEKSEGVLKAKETFQSPTHHAFDSDYRSMLLIRALARSLGEDLLLPIPAAGALLLIGNLSSGQSLSLKTQYRAEYLSVVLNGGSPNRSFIVSPSAEREDLVFVRRI